MHANTTSLVGPGEEEKMKTTRGRQATRGAAALLIGIALAGCSSDPGTTLQTLDPPTSSAVATTSPSPSAPSSTTDTSSTATSTAVTTLSGSPTSSTDTADGGLSAEETADRAAAQAQDTAFWQVYAALPHTPEDQWASLLEPVAVEPMVANAQTDARAVVAAGWDSYGELGHRYSWPQPIAGADTAVLTDCQDGSQSGAVETATGNKQTVGVERSHKQSTLVRGADGIWRVQGSFFLKDEPC